MPNGKVLKCTIVGTEVLQIICGTWSFKIGIGRKSTSIEVVKVKIAEENR